MIPQNPQTQVTIMALWDKVRTELDRAGKVAQGALDEGKLRLDAFRARQLADKAAQALGYAVYRARQSGQELDADSYARLSSTIASREADAARYEAQLREVAAQRRRRGTRPDAASAPASEPPPASADAAEPAVVTEPHQPL
jgi:hypothetical protein